MNEDAKKKDYLEISEKDLISSYSNIYNTLHIFNIRKPQLKNIINGLELLKETQPKNKILAKQIREYTSYLKMFEKDNKYK